MPSVTLRQCHLCGNNFLPQSSSTKYCSDICRTNSRGERVRRVCERCGKNFEVTRNRMLAKYCSRDCRYPPFITSCVTCGQVMRVKPASGQRFCSMKCFGASDERKEHGKSAWQRFNERVDKTPGYGPKGDCWLWTGTIDESGYGRFRPKGKIVGVHRYSYAHFKGPIPEGLWVLHECDNRPCCNPDHLWLGTCADNTKDMISKGRSRNPVGEKNGAAKLTEQDVRNILASDLCRATLAKNYNVSNSTIYLIKVRKTWSYLSCPDDQLTMTNGFSSGGKG
jgi:hypothetical protein